MASIQKYLSSSSENTYSKEFIEAYNKRQERLAKEQADFEKKQKEALDNYNVQTSAYNNARSTLGLDQLEDERQARIKTKNGGTMIYNNVTGKYVSPSDLHIITDDDGNVVYSDVDVSKNSTDLDRSKRIVNGQVYNGTTTKGNDVSKLLEQSQPKNFITPYISEDEINKSYESAYNSKLKTLQNNKAKLIESMGEDYYNQLVQEVNEGTGRKGDAISGYTSDVMMGYLQVKRNQAWDQYLKDGTYVSKQKALELDKQVRNFQNENLDIGKGALSSSANYIPQMVYYTTKNLGGAAAGLAAGALAGYATGDPGIGVKVGSLVYGASAVGTGFEATYSQTRGGEFGDMVSLGIPEDIAREASANSAFWQALIEEAETATDIYSLFTAPQSAETIGALAAYLKAWGTNIITEGLEEGSQSIVGFLYEKGAAERAGLDMKSYSVENMLDQAWEEAKGGAEVGATMFLAEGLPHIVFNKVNNTIAQRASIENAPFNQAAETLPTIKDSNGNQRLDRDEFKTKVEKEYDNQIALAKEKSENSDGLEKEDANRLVKLLEDGKRKTLKNFTKIADEIDKVYDAQEPTEKQAVSEDKKKEYNSILKEQQENIRKNRPQFKDIELKVSDKITKGQKYVSEFAKRVLGLDIVYYTATNAETENETYNSNGLWRKDGNTVYINSSNTNTKNVLSILGHEYSHYNLERMKPAEKESFLNKMYDDQEAISYAIDKGLEKDANRIYTPQELLYYKEERYSDAVGEFLSDPFTVMAIEDNKKNAWKIIQTGLSNLAENTIGIRPQWNSLNQFNLGGLSKLEGDVLPATQQRQLLAQIKSETKAPVSNNAYVTGNIDWYGEQVENNRSRDSIARGLRLRVPSNQIDNVLSALEKEYANRKANEELEQRKDIVITAEDKQKMKEAIKENRKKGYAPSQALEKIEDIIRQSNPEATPDQIENKAVDMYREINKDQVLRSEMITSKDGKQLSPKQVNSEGERLTPQQMKKYKYSIVRDSLGRLLVVYHTTTQFMGDHPFYTFEPEKNGPRYRYRGQTVIFTTSNRMMSESYAAGNLIRVIKNEKINIDTVKGLLEKLSDETMGSTRYKLEKHFNTFGKDAFYDIVNTDTGEVVKTFDNFTQLKEEFMDWYEPEFNKENAKWNRDYYYGEKLMYPLYMNITKPFVIDGKNYISGGARNWDNLTFGKKEKESKAITKARQDSYIVDALTEYLRYGYNKNALLDAVSRKIKSEIDIEDATRLVRKANDNIANKVADFLINDKSIQNLLDEVIRLDRESLVEATIPTAKQLEEKNITFDELMKKREAYNRKQNEFEHAVENVLNKFFEEFINTDIKEYLESDKNLYVSETLNSKNGNSARWLYNFFKDKFSEMYEKEGANLSIAYKTLPSQLADILFVNKDLETLDEKIAFNVKSAIRNQLVEIAKDKHYKVLEEKGYKTQSTNGIVKAVLRKNYNKNVANLKQTHEDISNLSVGAYNAFGEALRNAFFDTKKYIAKSSFDITREAKNSGKEISDIVQDYFYKKVIANLRNNTYFKQTSPGNIIKDLEKNPNILKQYYDFFTETDLEKIGFYTNMGGVVNKDMIVLDNEALAKMNDVKQTTLDKIYSEANKYNVKLFDKFLTEWYYNTSQEEILAVDGYDGVIFYGIEDNGSDDYEEVGDVYVAFASNQVDLTSNKNPTMAKDIRRSESVTDNKGKELSREVLTRNQNSKVRTKDGKLIRLYHSTDAEYDEIDMKRSGEKYQGYSLYGKGFYLTPNKEEAIKWADNAGISAKDRRIIEAYANIVNPFYISEGNNKETVAKMVKAIEERYDYIKKNIEGVKDAKPFKVQDFEVKYGGGILDLLEDDLHYNAQEIQDFLKSFGYDGIMDVYETDEDIKGQVVAFYPNQVKYVDNENPTDRPEMNKSESVGPKTTEGTVIPPRLAQWADRSKAKIDGDLIEYYHGSPFAKDEGFDQFKPRYRHNGAIYGDGYYLTSNYEKALGYTDFRYSDKEDPEEYVKSFVVNTLNPLDITEWEKCKAQILRNFDSMIEHFNPEFEGGMEYYGGWGGKVPTVEEMRELLDGTNEYASGDDWFYKFVERFVPALAKRPYINEYGVEETEYIDTREIYRYLGFDSIMDYSDIVLFESNQAKYLDNEEPTTDSRFAYSESINNLNFKKNTRPNDKKSLEQYRTIKNRISDMVQTIPMKGGYTIVVTPSTKYNDSLTIKLLKNGTLVKSIRVLNKDWWNPKDKKIVREIRLSDFKKINGLTSSVRSAIEKEFAEGIEPSAVKKAIARTRAQVEGKISRLEASNKKEKSTAKGRGRAVNWYSKRYDRSYKANQKAQERFKERMRDKDNVIAGIRARYKARDEKRELNRVKKNLIDKMKRFEKSQAYKYLTDEQKKAYEATFGMIYRGGLSKKERTKLIERIKAQIATELDEKGIIASNKVKKMIEAPNQVTLSEVQTMEQMEELLDTFKYVVDEAKRQKELINTPRNQNAMVAQTNFANAVKQREAEFDEAQEKRDEKKALRANTPTGNIVNGISGTLNRAGRTLKNVISNSLSTIETELLNIAGGDRNSRIMDLYNNLNAGVTRDREVQVKLNQIMSRFMTDKKYAELRKSLNRRRAWTDTGTTVTDNKGKKHKLILNRGRLMALAMHSLQEQSIKHISGAITDIVVDEDLMASTVTKKGGGIRVPREDLMRAGRIAEAYNEGYVAKLTREELDNIVGKTTDKNGNVYFTKLTEEENEFIKGMQEFFKQTKEYLNSVSKALHGYNVAEVENYFPLVADKSYIYKKLAKGTNLTARTIAEAYGIIDNAGFVTPREEDAFNPIMLEDVADVLTRTIKGVSKYYGYNIALHDNNILLGTKFDDVNVEGALKKLDPKFKANYEALEDFISGIDAQPNDLFAKFRGKHAEFTLGLNPASWVKQLLSVPTTAKYFTAKELAGFVAGGEAELYNTMKNFLEARGEFKKGKVLQDFVRYLTGDLDYRHLGFGLADLSDVKENQSLFEKMDIAKGVARFDMLGVNTVTRMFLFAELGRRNLLGDNLQKLSADEIDQIFTDVGQDLEHFLRVTQPDYSQVNRSNIVRQKGPFSRFLTMYSTPSLQMANNLMQSLSEFNYARSTGDKKLMASSFNNLTKSAFGIAASTIGGVLISRAFSKMFKSPDDEDDYDFGKEVIVAMLSPTLVLDDVARGLMGMQQYESQVPELIAFDALTGIAQDIYQIANGTESSKFKKWKDIIKNLGTVTGIPTRDFMKIGKAVLMYADSDLYYDIALRENTNAYKKWLDENTGENTREFYKAYIATREKKLISDFGYKKGEGISKGEGSKKEAYRKALESVFGKNSEKVNRYMTILGGYKS